MKKIKPEDLKNFIMDSPDLILELRQKMFDLQEKLFELQQKIFGKKHLRLKTAGAVAFLVAACMSTLGVLTYIGVLDDSRYEVSGLTIKQNGLGLDVTWNEEECDGYEVFLFQNGELPQAIQVEENKCRIELEELGKDYKVVVTAKTEDGASKGAASKKIHAVKIAQPIETSKEEFAGFEGNADNLKAKAPEQIEYVSTNEEVVEVNENGTLEYKKPGEAEIKIKAEEGKQYRKGEKRIEVTVFPDQLKAPEAKLAKEEDTTVTVRWSEVAFAQKYNVMKRNPVDGNYELVEETDAKTRSIELPRSHAIYKVRATAEVEGESVESALSKEVKVKSPAESAETYSSYNNLRTLDHDSLELITNVNGLGNATVPQSMSLVNGNFVISYASHSGNAGALVEYDQNGNRVRESSTSGMGHANGSTYNPNTGKIYTVRTHRSIWSPLCTTFNAEDFSGAGSFNLPKNCSGIAYDGTLNKYYLSKGNEIYITDTDFKVEKFIWKKIRYNHAQDIGGAEGVVMVCTWVSGNESYIDMYRATDGAYIGGYSVPIGEIESVVMVDKHLVLLMNNSGGGNVDQLLRTVEPVALP